ncbi:MAG: hypothetical protein KAI24_10210, partial [Planctomycetes bacterium]|nr:hypothetical protein [Planctomycetota bacterium]
RALLRAGRPRDALTRVEQRVEICRRMLEADPESVGGHERLGVALSQFGQAMHGSRRADLAERALLEACRVLGRGLELQPGHRGIRLRLGEAHNTLGVVYRALARQADAVASFQQAVDGLRTLAAASPASGVLHGQLAGALCNLGIARRDELEPAARIALFDEAQVALASSLQVEPTSAMFRNYQRTLTREHVAALVGSGDLAKAADVARAVLRSQPAEGRMSAVLALANVAAAAIDEGRDGLAEDLGDEAVALIRAAGADGSLPPALFALDEMRPFVDRDDYQALAKRYGR